MKARQLTPRERAHRIAERLRSTVAGAPDPLQAFLGAVKPSVVLEHDGTIIDLASRGYQVPEIVAFLMLGHGVEMSAKRVRRVIAGAAGDAKEPQRFKFNRQAFAATRIAGTGTLEAAPLAPAAPFTSAPLARAPHVINARQASQASALVTPGCALMDEARALYADEVRRWTARVNGYRMECKLRGSDKVPPLDVPPHILEILQADGNAP